MSFYPSKIQHSRVSTFSTPETWGWGPSGEMVPSGIWHICGQTHTHTQKPPKIAWYPPKNRVETWTICFTAWVERKKQHCQRRTSHGMFIEVADVCNFSGKPIHSFVFMEGIPQQKGLTIKPDRITWVDDCCNMLQFPTPWGDYGPGYLRWVVMRDGYIHG